MFNEEVESYLANGFDGFLPKPLEKEALARLIVTQLDGKTLLLPQPDPNDSICKINEHGFCEKRIESDLIVESEVEQPDLEESPVTISDSKLIIDSKVIEGDLSILGLDKMKQIVGLFEQSSLETLKEMADASEAENARGVKSLAHKLKGSAGSLGLLALFDVCKNIEISSEPLTQYRESSEELTVLAKDSLAALQQHV